MTAMPRFVPLRPPNSVGERVAVEPGLVGQPLHPVEQLLPLLVRQALVVPVGARVLATMVEEADVVVLLLERRDHVAR